MIRGIFKRKIPQQEFISLSPVLDAERHQNVGGGNFLAHKSCPPAGTAPVGAAGRSFQLSYIRAAGTPKWPLRPKGGGWH